MSKPDQSEKDPSRSDFQRGMAKAQRLYAKAAALADARARIESEDPLSAGELVFMSSPLVQVTMPHSDPGDVRIWSRENGYLTLYIRPGVEADESGGHRPIGLPYGVYPRLILSWVCSQVAKHGRRRLDLGSSLRSYMRDLGVTPSGGEQGTARRFREQMRRLFSAQIGMIWQRPGREKRRAAMVADELDLWWDPKNPASKTMWKSSVQLSTTFYQMIQKRPVPADRRVLKEIKDSALAIDMYFWTTYKAATIEEPLALSWQQVHDQLGADYQHTKHFAAEARKHLEQIRLIWADLQYKTPRGRLVLLPSNPSVPRR
jgi:hypothetical protein